MQFTKLFKEYKAMRFFHYLYFSTSPIAIDILVFLYTVDSDLYRYIRLLCIYKEFFCEPTISHRLSSTV